MPILCAMPFIASFAHSIPVVEDAPQVTPTTLVDQEGTVFTMQSLSGKTVLLNFIFTLCPGPCPVQTTQLSALQSQLTQAEKDTMHLLSVSVDPLNDTPQRLFEYGRKRGVSFDNWSLITGPEELIDSFVASFGADVSRAAEAAIEHSLTVYLVGADGELWQAYSTLDVERIAADMRTASRLAAHQ